MRDGHDAYLLTSPRGHIRDTLSPDRVRERVVDGVAERAARVVANSVVPADTGRGIAFDSPEFDAAVKLRERALAWATARLAHQLYPAHYPDPGPFRRDHTTPVADGPAAAA
ncbi:hypothetical protein [Amycolatopsis sp. NPDC058986]|uniref:hypothetical protein n=1 Tax=unclassified Amycolatopsis TaxID=2618356 RepID=UPI00366B4BF5